MKIFISHRFIGEDINNLKQILGKIKKILESKGNEVFCSIFMLEYFEKENFSAEDNYAYCLERLKENDVVLFLIKSKEKSHGMKLELDEAIKNNKKILLAIQKNLEFDNFRTKAHKILEYDNLENLYVLLGLANLNEGI